MAKRTAVIDIGSNSVRMVVFEKSSRFAFSLLHESKSRVRISEGAYADEGNLQPAAVERAMSALGEFLSIAQAYGTRKLLCVATSAVRDAPNRAQFLKRARDELGLRIKVIDGEKEAYLGGVACANLLPRMKARTIDIGGGSTECA
ncbi:MAG: Ppx/GppA family phosphatase, partial [Campylobacterales bacterium]